MEIVDWDWCIGVVPKGGMLGHIFQFGLSRILLVCPSHWVDRLGSAQVLPLGAFPWLVAMVLDHLLPKSWLDVNGGIRGTLSARTVWRPRVKSKVADE